MARQLYDVLREAITEEGLSKEKLREASDILLEGSSRLLEQEFRKGNKGNLLTTMSLYLHLGKPIPQWAQKAFLEACDYRPKCWDDVFGRPNGRGMRRKEETEAYFEGSELHEKGSKIDAPLFEAIAKKMHTSVGTAKRRYYGRKKTFDDVKAIIDELGLTPGEARAWGDVIFLGQCLIDAMEEMETSQSRPED